MHFPTPDCSVVICSRNEGGALRRTVDSVLRQSGEPPPEVVIIDDGSSDGSTEFLGTAEYFQRNIRTARNETPRGIIQSRALGVELARGRTLCILDAHCLLERGWLARLTECLATIHGRGLVVPAIYRLDERSWSIQEVDLPSTGCTLINPLLDFNWTPPREIEGKSCTCTIGGGAWLTSREWYEHIGGLDRGMLHWGGENIDFPLRTWLAGGYCLVAADARIGHLFKKADPRRKPTLSPDLLTYNKLRAAHTVFSPQTLTRIMTNLSQLKGFEEALESLRRTPDDLLRLKAHFESTRTRSDRWLIDTFQLPILEPLYFHKRPRWAVLGVESIWRRQHPSVTVVVTTSHPSTGAQKLMESLLQRTTYSRSSFLLACSGRPRSFFGLPEVETILREPRVDFLATGSPAGGGSLHNLAALRTQSDILIFLRDDAVLLDDHCIEEVILLFERRVQLFLAAPRIQLVADEHEVASSAAPAIFDEAWDWDAPGFTTSRRYPQFDRPYQALTVPSCCFAVHRERFLELGGFDRTVLQGEPPLLDLAVHGWLAGYEVFVDPGLYMGCKPSAKAPGAEENAWTHYRQMLPAAKYFTNPSRVAWCRNRSLEAAPVLERNRYYLDRRRRQFLEYRRFDDDWLFCKFQSKRGSQCESSTTHER